MEPATLRLPPELRTPPLPATHVRGGDRPSSTDLELPLNSHPSISNPIVHSCRATSRRTARCREDRRRSEILVPEAEQGTHGAGPSRDGTLLGSRLKRSRQRRCHLACKRSRQRGQRSNEVRSCATFFCQRHPRHEGRRPASGRENLVSRWIFAGDGGPGAGLVRSHTPRLD